MAVKQTCGTFTESTIKTQAVEGVESVSDAAPYGRGTWAWDWDLSRLALGSSAEILVKWRTASGTWFGETSRQSQAKPVKARAHWNFTKPRTRSHTLLTRKNKMDKGSLLPVHYARIDFKISHNTYY